MSQAFHVANESKEDKQRRIDANKQHKADRQAKLERTRYGGAKDDVALANIFRQFGIDFLNIPREKAFALVPQTLEGKRYDHLSKDAIEFLVDTFGAKQRVTPDNRPVLAFSIEDKGDPMSLVNDLVERSAQPRKVVKAVYEALVKQIRISLRKERYLRLPDIGRFKIGYRPAKEKRKGMNPFTGKKQWFKAKPASNKLRFSPAKTLKVFCAEKIEVVEPPKKKKKKSKKD